jgi:hypothetical protein
MNIINGNISERVADGTLDSLYLKVIAILLFPEDTSLIQAVFLESY